MGVEAPVLPSKVGAGTPLVLFQSMAWKKVGRTEKFSEPSIENDGGNTSPRGQAGDGGSTGTGATSRYLKIENHFTWGQRRGLTTGAAAGLILYSGPTRRLDVGWKEWVRCQRFNR